MTDSIIHQYTLADGVKAFSTTRKGGVSKGSYGTMNINPFCGDVEEAVAQNRQILADTLDVDASRIILPHQVHGIESRMIAEEFLQLPESIRHQLLEGVVAVMTNISGVCIGVSTADCIPVLLYDAAHHAVAAVHAGWRGTLNHIVLKVVREMGMMFHTAPKDLKAIIGPGISEANFEVGQEVYDQFQTLNFDMDRIAKMHDKWHIDLPLCNRMQLEGAGISADNILEAGICTYDAVDTFFSARRLGKDSGRIYTGIVLA